MKNISVGTVFLSVGSARVVVGIVARFNHYKRVIAAHRIFTHLPVEIREETGAAERTRSFAVGSSVGTILAVLGPVDL